MKEDKITSGWEKARVVGNLFTALIFAVATIMGSIVIPDKINRHSLEAQWINELSQLVPQLYNSTVSLRSSTIAMASYGTPAVPLLLLVLEDAVENQNEDMVKAITSAMKYMKTESKKEVQARLEEAIGQLNQRYSTSKDLKYIEHMVTILNWPRLDNESLDILAKYFSAASEFTVEQDMLQELNGIILRVLSDNDFTISELKLQGLDFEGQDLKEIKFIGADLKNANLRNSKLYDCEFKGAFLNSCDLREARFFEEDEDSLYILDTFRKFAKSHWREAKLDTHVLDILRELDNKPEDTKKLLTLANIIKDDYF